MRIVSHPSPLVLEEYLLRAIETARAGNPRAPILVLVPSRDMADHVRSHLVDRLGAILALEVLPYRALALRLAAGAPAPLLPSHRVLQAFLDDVLSVARPSRWADYVEARPGAARALLASMRDLRESGLSAAEVRHVALPGTPEEDLAWLYSAYEERLSQAEQGGVLDDAGLISGALEHAPAHAAGHALILHHGAYELTGIQLALLRALDSGHTVEFLLPSCAAGPAFAYAEEYAARHLSGPADERIVLDPPPPPRRTGSPPESRASPGQLGLFDPSPEAPAAAPAHRRGVVAGRIEALYDEDRDALPPAAGVELAHAQGAHAEVAHAVRLALERVAEGVPPGEVAFIARELSPYTVALEAALEERGLPWTTSAGAPLRRQPAVRDLMRLLELLRDDFPRAPTAVWLASPRLRWKTLASGAERVPAAHSVDRWSREAGIIGGLAEWTGRWAEWAAEARTRPGWSAEQVEASRQRAARRARSVGIIAGALSTLAELAAADQPATWSDWASRVEELAGRALGLQRGSGGAADLLAEILDDMTRLQQVAGRTRPLPFRRMLAWLDAAVQETPMPLGDDAGAGFVALDAMRSRGMTFDTVLLIGMHSGLFPRRVREDPFLPDDLRRRLRQEGGKPLTLKLDGDREERLILALTLAAARERLHVSWQRAGEDGRSKLPSMSLREVARVALGEATLEKARDAAHRVASHPARALQLASSRPAGLAVDEEALLVALDGTSPAAALASLGDDPADRAHRLQALATLESFSPEDLRFDAGVGALVSPPEPMSVSSLECLGGCPLKFFFRDLLRIRPLEEEASATSLESRDIGNRVHRLLEDLYTRLVEEGSFDAPLEARTRRAEEHLDSLWSAVMDDLGTQRARRLPLLWGSLLGQWRTAVAGFVREDLARMEDEGWRPDGFEKEVLGTINAGKHSLQLRARFDRVLRRDRETRVGDYKTGRGKLKDYTSPLKVLRLEKLQVPLYRLLLDEQASVELIGVGPDYRPGGAREEHALPGPYSGLKPAFSAGFHESLEVALGLLEAGQFPLHPGRHCNWCDFAPACRRTHTPTEERNQSTLLGGDLADLKKKSQRMPLLADVREKS